MSKIKKSELDKFIKNCLEKYTDRRITNISEHTFREVIYRKNPYLLAANGIEDIDTLVDDLITQYIKTSDETIFGQEVFEEIAIYVSDGVKSGYKSVDIEIRKNGFMIELVSVKSGPYIFNSSSKKKQDDHFISHTKILQSKDRAVRSIVGYCYGRKKKNGKSSKYIFEEYAGQDFWKEISGDENLYVLIMDLIRKHSKSISDTVNKEIEKTRKRWTEEAKLIIKYDDKGKICWDHLVRKLCSYEFEEVEKLKKQAEKLQKIKPKKENVAVNKSSKKSA
jgi:hypothetical protein